MEVEEPLPPLPCRVEATLRAGRATSVLVSLRAPGACMQMSANIYTGLMTASCSTLVSVPSLEASFCQRRPVDCFCASAVQQSSINIAACLARTIHGHAEVALRVPGGPMREFAALFLPFPLQHCSSVHHWVFDCPLLSLTCTNTHKPAGDGSSPSAVSAPGGACDST